MSDFITRIKVRGEEYDIRDAEAARIDSPEFTGIPLAPTADADTDSPQIATTAFVQRAVKDKFGKPGGIATLDENGLVPTSQLPSYVDDVLDGTYDETNNQFLDLNGNPYSPESGKIYIDVNTRITYRWSGTFYVEIASSLALGTTAETAFPGDRGLAIEQELSALTTGGAVTLIGTVGEGGELAELPPRYRKGDMYQVVTAGEYAGKECEVGDFIIAIRDNRVTIVGLPEVIYDDFNNHILYQIYNPITDEYDSAIYYVATWESPYNVYGYSYRETEPEYKILAFTSCVKYKTENNGITWDVVSVNTLEGLTERESETVNYKVLYTTYPIYNADGTGVIAIPANPYTDNSMDAFNADWAVIQGNIEDSISEGAVYIDPEEESPDLPDIEDVTAAKFVSYNNADSGLEARNVQEAIDVIDNKKVNVSDIVDNLLSTDDKAPLSAKQGKELNDNFNNYIAENLIAYPYFNTTSTVEGVTFTDNGDGTINANGTATGSSSGFTCRLYNEGHLGYKLVLPKGTYTLSGCPDGGSGGTYFLQVGRNTGSWQTIATDTGEGATFTIDEEMQVSVTIAIIGGTTVNNLVFKPMLEVGTVAHEYKPYSSTKVTKGDIVDNLLTGRADLPLSANQGRALNDKICKFVNVFNLYKGQSRIISLSSFSACMVMVLTTSGPGAGGAYWLANAGSKVWNKIQESISASAFSFAYDSSVGIWTLRADNYPIAVVIIGEGYTIT